MTDIFSALANPNARLVLETLAKKPGLSATKLAESTKLTTVQISNLLVLVSEAKLVRSTGSGASKKYSLNAKGFSPYLTWLARVAESQAVSLVEAQVAQLGGKVGSAVSTGTSWVSDKVNISVDVDAKKLGRQLGKLLAEVKAEASQEVKEVRRDAKKIVKSVKERITS
jgi:DNA-binding transcriptional ArsR family regulator